MAGLKCHDARALEKWAEVLKRQSCLRDRRRHGILVHRKVDVQARGEMAVGCDGAGEQRENGRRDDDDDDMDIERSQSIGAYAVCGNSVA